MANKAIGTIGNVQTMTVGGSLFVDTTNIIILFGGTDGATNVNSGSRKFGAQGGVTYQVTTGKTLIINAYRGIQLGSAGNDSSMAQVDNSTLGFNVSTALTNPIFFGSESSTYKSLFYVTSTIGSTFEHGSVAGKVAALKYLAFQQSATANSSLSHFAYGYET